MNQSVQQALEAFSKRYQQAWQEKHQTLLLYFLETTNPNSRDFPVFSCIFCQASALFLSTPPQSSHRLLYT